MRAGDVLFGNFAEDGGRHEQAGFGLAGYGFLCQIVAARIDFPGVILGDSVGEHQMQGRGVQFINILGLAAVYEFHTLSLCLPVDDGGRAFAPARKNL